MVFGFMVVIMVGFLVMIPLGGQLGCGASSAEEQIAAEIAKYEATLNASPDDVAALRGLGDTYVSRANQQEPRSDAQRADWNLAMEQYEKAVVVLAKEKGAAAREQQVETLKQVVDVRLMAAQVLGQDPALQEPLSESTRRHPTSMRASLRSRRRTRRRTSIGRARDNAGDTNTALLAFSKFLELAPDSPDAPDVKQWIEDNTPKPTPSPSSTKATAHDRPCSASRASVTTALGVIVLVGEVDIYTAPRFKERCLSCWTGAWRAGRRSERRHVHRLDRTRGPHRRPAPSARRRRPDGVGRGYVRGQSVLTITGLDRVFEIHATREAAEVALA